VALSKLVKFLRFIFSQKAKAMPQDRQKRPKHLNLFQIRQPVPAVVSILHRISGAVLFLLIGLFLWLLEYSLSSPEAFTGIHALLTQPLPKLVFLALLWAYLHHLGAGMRHLAGDLRVGTTLAAARASSWAVLAFGGGLTLIAAVLIW